MECLLLYCTKSRFIVLWHMTVFSHWWAHIHNSGPISYNRQKNSHCLFISFIFVAWETPWPKATWGRHGSQVTVHHWRKSGQRLKQACLLFRTFLPLQPKSTAWTTTQLQTRALLAFFSSPEPLACWMVLPTVDWSPPHQLTIEIIPPADTLRPSLNWASSWQLTSWQTRQGH